MATKEKEKAGNARSLEQTLSELESITSRIESDDLGLEESLRIFEDGIQLIRQAQTSLQAAEQKVVQLLERDGDIEAIPIPPGSKDS